MSVTMKIGDLSPASAPARPFGRSVLWSLAILPVPGIVLAGWLAMPASHAGAPASQHKAEVVATAAPPAKPAALPQVADAAGEVVTNNAAPSAPAASSLLSPGLMTSDAVASASAPPAPDTTSAIVTKAVDISAANTAQPQAQAQTHAQPAAPQPVAAQPAAAPMRASAAAPAVKPPEKTQVASAAEPEQTGGLVNINTASFEQLNSIPGAGPIGRAIIKGRPYASEEELVTKKVLRRASFEQIKDRITAR